MSDAKADPAPNCDLARPPDGPPSRPPDCMCWFVRVALIGYVVFLFSLALLGRHEPTLQVGDLVRPLDCLVGILVAGVLSGVRFLVLGFLVAFAAGRAKTPLPFLAVLQRWLLILMLGIGLFALLSVIESGRPPGVLSSSLPLAGYVVGMWIGCTCLRGHRAVLWLVPKLGLFLLALGTGTTALVFLAMDDDSLSFQPPKVTSAEKRRLVDVLEGSRPTGNGLHRLRLSERDINLLLAVAMPQAFPEGKARIAVAPGTITGDMSARVSDSSVLPPYLNLHVACRGGVTTGQPQFQLQQCRIGRLPLPQLVLDLVSRSLTYAILDDPELEDIVAAIESVRVEHDGVEAVFSSGGLRDKLEASLLARLGEKPDVVRRTRIHFRHLAQTAEDLPSDDRFAAFLQAAFRLAKKRSKAEDPVTENRAAILALAILLGHWRVETLVGPVSDDELRLAARRRVGRVTLRGRQDWRKHFFVSAALALLSNESLSDEAGLLKEELDAGEGGSGFSFSDLLADRAGTLFALAATRDEPSARRMQDRLAAGFETGAVFPPASDLPERIPDRELQAEYGGVGGEKYKEVIREIARRLKACEALR